MKYYWNCKGTEKDFWFRMAYFFRSYPREDLYVVYIENAECFLLQIVYTWHLTLNQYVDVEGFYRSEVAMITIVFVLF